MGPVHSPHLQALRPGVSTPGSDSFLPTEGVAGALSERQLGPSPRHQDPLSSAACGLSRFLCLEPSAPSRLSPRDALWEQATSLSNMLLAECPPLLPLPPPAQATRPASGLAPGVQHPSLSLEPTREGNQAEGRGRRDRLGAPSGWSFLSDGACHCHMRLLLAASADGEGRGLPNVFFVFFFNADFS